MALLYFLSKLQSVGQDDLSRAGVGQKEGKSSFSFRITSAGPDKQPGAVVVFNPGNPEARSPQIGYFPLKQEWQKASGGKFWIGREKDKPVRPADLQRTEIIAGHKVKLADGQEWMIPVARVFPQGTMLPQSLILGPDGEVVKEVLPRYARLGQKAERVWQEFKKQMGWLEEGENPESMTEKEEWEIATEVLGINYRLGAWEISFLRLFTTENLERVLSAFVDIPTMLAASRAMQEASKKKENVSIPGGNNTGDGGQADATGTFRP